MKEKMTYIKCKVSKGTFENERFVIVRNDKDEMIGRGVFPKKLIKGAKLRINIFEAKKDKVLIGVDGDGSGGYGFWSESRIWVPKVLIVKD